MSERYSQYLEQDFVLEACSGITSARFLDVGAWDPKTFSNIRALWELGWGGVVIEPSPGPLQSLIREYGQPGSRVKVIGAAVAVTPGLIELAVTDDAVSQEAERAEVGEWKDAGGFYGRVTVPAISLSGLFHQLGGDFQMVSLDTEGTSVDLFAEMMRIGPRPRCVVVEHDQRIVELMQYAQEANYRQVHLNGTNVVLRWNG